MFMYSYCYICSALAIVFQCIVLCICVKMCTVLLAPGVNPLAVNKYTHTHTHTYIYIYIYTRIYRIIYIAEGYWATGICVPLVHCSRHDGHFVRCPPSRAIKTDRVSENGCVCVFRWKRKRETFGVRNVAFLASDDGWFPKHY